MPPRKNTGENMPEAPEVSPEVTPEVAPTPVVKPRSQAARKVNGSFPPAKYPLGNGSFRRDC